MMNKIINDNICSGIIKELVKNHLWSTEKWKLFKDLLSDVKATWSLFNRFSIIAVINRFLRLCYPVTRNANLSLTTLINDFQWRWLTLNFYYRVQSHGLFSWQSFLNRAFLFNNFVLFDKLSQYFPTFFYSNFSLLISRKVLIFWYKSILRIPVFSHFLFCLLLYSHPLRRV